jgi:phosphoribosylformimino-5-aminoimidazole carboxamide ribotide isomerase
MELIPVLDLSGGVAVHAAGGNRARYRPVQSLLTPGLAGDALALARAYRALPGVGRCYVADLDAIGGGMLQHRLLERLRSGEGFGGPLLLDAGVASLADRERVAPHAAEIVVGLETLSSMAVLAAIATRGPVTFSLDLRHGAAMTTRELAATSGTDPVTLAMAASDAGAGTLIVIDVARVGSGDGLDLQLLRSLRRALPGVRLLAGGGVRDREDLRALEDAGCEGALVATALHAGALGDAAVRQWPPSGVQ